MQDSKKTQKKTDAEEKLVKALADFQNLQRDMVKRLEAERIILKSVMLKDLLELGDDLEIALQHVSDSRAVAESLPLLLEKYKRVTENLGAEEIACKTGDVFDPTLHEAIGVDSDGKDGTISKIMQKGYKIGEIIVRPVRVVVNKDISTSEK